MSDSPAAIVKSVGLDRTFSTSGGPETISLEVVDLTGKNPALDGVDYTEFIYPSSVYKKCVAMQIAKELSHEDYYLTTRYVVPFLNAVDSSKEISWDPRPLLQVGDTVTINYLLDFMITRSDNSAANCLIDVARRDSINKTMLEYGWYGSEVTRKFLSREYEDPSYKNARGYEYVRTACGRFHVPHLHESACQSMGQHAAEGLTGKTARYDEAFGGTSAQHNVLP